ncbi:glycerophosphodiester phosphodiesterase [Halovenus sp. HT40]|uniref:glycerophosphodiester phosphodiesterase n=1 Tax=Halovenus sp. HT40 TaxID=3126691 RepID=UPI00300E748A
MTVIGHRGCAKEFPENTLAAVRGCAPHVDMVEIDVRRCGSGELVVFHDSDLDRLTDATGAVSQYEYQELSRLTIGDSAEPIPKLGDVCDDLPSELGLNIELKEPGLHEAVLDILSSHSHEVLISAFDPAALHPFRDVDVATALVCAESVEAGVETALELGCESLHPRYTIIDEEAIQRAQRTGLSVNAWTVPTATEVRRLQEIGADGVIVDSWKITTGI